MTTKSHLFTAAALACMGACSLSAQATLIVGWDFDFNSTGWTPQICDRTGDGYGDESVNSNFSDVNKVGTIYWDGSHGSKQFSFREGLEVSTFTGSSSINQTIGSREPDAQFSTADQDPAALAFSAVNGDFVIQFPTAGYEKIVMSYAACRQGDGSGAANTIAWAYSTDGSTYISTGITHEIAVEPYALHTLNLAAFTDLNNKAAVYLRGTLAGSPGFVAFNSLTAIDNIQVNGIPANTSVSFWATTPTELEWRVTSRAYVGEPGIGIIYDGFWPFVYTLGMTPNGWLWVYESGASAQGFFAYWFEEATWIYGYNAGFYYNYKSSQFELFNNL
ncbi:MAG: hypothetical protein SFY80_02075 [Verrucomicrobiota bacterium]|nr:hypothetical protein [Verrucomicrobiota bacterium]